MRTEKKGDFENPLIPEKEYNATFNDTKIFPRKNKDVFGTIIKFDVEHNGNTYTLPFFAPAKLSISRGDEEDSRLARNLKKINLLEPIVEELGVSEEVMSGEKRAVVKDSSEAQELKTVLKAFLTGKTIKVSVTTDERKKGDDRSMVHHYVSDEQTEKDIKTDKIGL